MGLPFQLYNLDALEFLAQLQSESVDLFVTDIAYESLEKHRNMKATTPRLVNWFPIFPNYKLPWLFAEMFRVLKRGSHTYMFCDDETSDIMRPMAVEAGFTVWKRLVWDKKHMGMGYHWRNRYEFILFLEKKPKRQLNSRSYCDVLRYGRIVGKYPTEKPVPLLKRLIKNSSNHGDVVCDMFMGSGAVGEAALRSGRQFIGNDIQLRAYLLSRWRLRHVLL